MFVRRWGADCAVDEVSRKGLQTTRNDITYVRTVYPKTRCTGNGLVVPSSSHKREVAGSIPGWVHKNFSLPSSAVTSPTDVIV
jgi:hypothetical protein